MSIVSNRNLNNNLLTGSIPITLNKIIGVGTTYAGLQQMYAQLGIGHMDIQSIGQDAMT
jgi:hypothetical protein